MASREHDALVEALSARMAAARDQSHEAQQAAFAEFALSLFPRVAADVTWETGNADGVPFQWIGVPQSSAERVLFYLHGGGYTQGSPETHRELASRVGRAAQARTFSVDYRLAPAHRFPAAVDDAVSAYRWLVKSGVPPKRIAFAGDSAGGGLAVATLFALRDAGDPLPACCACMSPYFDLEGTGASHISADDPIIDIEQLRFTGRQYADAADIRHPRASPIYGDFRGLPPLLFQAGTRELLMDDSTRAAEKARGDGVDVELEIYDGLIHVWHIWGARIPEAAQAVEKIGAFVRSHIPAAGDAHSA
jgi:acetyl esterase/lipase